MSPPGVDVDESENREPSPPSVQAHDEQYRHSVATPEEVEEGDVQRPQSEQEPENGEIHASSDEQGTAVDGQLSSHSAPAPDEISETPSPHGVCEPEREAEGSPTRVEEAAHDQEQTPRVAHGVETGGEDSPAIVKEGVEDPQQASLATHVETMDEDVEPAASAKVAETAAEQSASSEKESEKSGDVSTGDASVGATLSVQSDRPETDSGSEIVARAAETSTTPATAVEEAVQPKKRRKTPVFRKKIVLPATQPSTQPPLPRQLLPQPQAGSHQPSTQPAYQRQPPAAAQPPYPQTQHQPSTQPPHHRQPSSAAQPPHQRQTQPPRKGQPLSPPQPSPHPRVLPVQYHEGQHRDASHTSYVPRHVVAAVRQSSSGRTWSILPSGQVNSGRGARPIGNDHGNEFSESDDDYDNARPSLAAKVPVLPAV